MYLQFWAEAQASDEGPFTEVPPEPLVHVARLALELAAD